MYRASEPVVKSAPETFLSEGHSHSNRLSRRQSTQEGCGAAPPGGRSRKSAQRSVCRFPSSSTRRPGTAHRISARAMPRILRSDVLAHAEEPLTDRPGEVRFQWRWAPWTVAMPPHGRGMVPGRSGSKGWLSAGAGTWAVPSQRRLVDGEAVRRGLSIGRRCDRYLGTVTAPRVHFLWAESELRQDTARFESVRCCVPDRDSVGDTCPLGKQR